MKFTDEEEVKQFIEVATKIKLLQRAGEPIPTEVKEMINNKSESDIYFILRRMING